MTSHLKVFSIVKPERNLMKEIPIWCERECWKLRLSGLEDCLSLPRVCHTEVLTRKITVRGETISRGVRTDSRVGEKPSGVEHKINCVSPSDGRPTRKKEGS